MKQIRVRLRHTNLIPPFVTPGNLRENTTDVAFMTVAEERMQLIDSTE